MRIAPHVVVTSKNSVKELVARVVLDGIATHGHARALVGAAVYAVALRVLLAKSGTLGYGELIEALIDELAWQDPEIASRYIPDNWFESAARMRRDTSFVSDWRTTVDEMLDLLGTAQRSLNQGSLASDAETLKKLGTFDKRRNGAGTATAAGAIYLSARTATRPMSGLLRAAFLQSADTDTLASMTAALLGALHGHEWLGELRDRVQDRLYIRDLADRCQGGLGAPTVGREIAGESRVTDALLRDYTRSLASGKGGVARFVDGRPCQLLGSRDLESKGRDATRYTVEVQGQVVHIDDVRKVEPRSSRTGRGDSAIRQITVLVSNLGPVERFYRMTLGLPTRGTDQGEIIVCDLVRFKPDYQSRLRDSTTRGLLLTLDVPNLESVTERLNHEGVRFSRVEHGQSKSIRVADPAGNDVELRQAT
jgi:catechol-2,3-dioxygenase